MNWSEIQIDEYSYTTFKTPLGEFRIEWKHWKEIPSFCPLLDGRHVEEMGDYYYSLDKTKAAAKDYLVAKHKELEDFIFQL